MPVGRVSVLDSLRKVLGVFCPGKQGHIPLFQEDSNKITDEEFEELKKTGASESEIVEALGVMELFTPLEESPALLGGVKNE